MLGLGSGKFDKRMRQSFSFGVEQDVGIDDNGRGKEFT